MKRLFLFTLLTSTVLFCSAQEFSDNKKTYFISLDINGGYALTNKTESFEYSRAVANVWLRIQRRITNKINVNTGLRYYNLTGSFEDTSNLTPTSLEIPLSFEFPVFTGSSEYGNTSTTNNQLADGGFFIEPGVYYSFNNELSTKSESIILPDDLSNNFGASFRFSLVWRGSVDMYLETRYDINAFYEELDENYNRFNVLFGVNIYLFSF